MKQSKRFEVDFSFEGYCRGRGTMTIFAENEEQAKQMAESEDISLEHYIVRDDRSVEIESVKQKENS